MDFSKALTSAYLQSPCAVLPNALWKTQCEIPKSQHNFEITDGQVSELCLINEDRLLVYWKAETDEMDYTEVDTARLKLALVHARALANFPAEGLNRQAAYFRYFHNLQSLPDNAIPPGFRIQTIHPQAEAEEIATFITRCYPNISQSAENVLAWTKTPVFAPDLWLWLVDDTTGQPAALGIADLDRSIGEGSLEWVQTLPDHRQRGLGHALVGALLHRLAGRAKFATVSGEAANESNPGRLYRGCGFSGEDIWWVFG